MGNKVKDKFQILFEKFDQLMSDYKQRNAESFSKMYRDMKEDILNLKKRSR